MILFAGIMLVAVLLVVGYKVFFDRPLPRKKTDPAADAALKANIDELTTAYGASEQTPEDAAVFIERLTAAHKERWDL